MPFSDDPVRDAEQYYARQDRELERRPVCDECGHHIQADHFYWNDGKRICPECLETYYRKEVEDYMEG